MENSSQQFVMLMKSLKLDAEHYGYWKVQMKQHIQSIDMEAWFAVEDGWEHPTTKNEDEETVLKPKKSWTTDEKNEAKYNSRALSAIFSSLPMNQFTRVQGCTSAKEAWEILQVSFEGTSSVKRTRIDMLASDFENLTMKDCDTVDEFSSKLSSIAQEAIVLGKKYKDKKLVKKFLRSLPAKFQSHKSAIDVSLNSDELKFDQVVGMMKAYELQLRKKEQTSGKGIALVANEHQVAVTEDKVGIIVRKYFRKMEKGQRRGPSTQFRSEANKGKQNAEKKCLECEGVGHYKSDCPTIRRRNSLKCFGCNGFGHTKAECHGSSNSQEKSYVTWSESDSEDSTDDGEEILNNYVAYLGIIDEEANQEDTSDEHQLSDSEDEESDICMEDQITLLIEELIVRKKENQKLTTENMNLRKTITTLKSELDLERTKSVGLEKKFEEQLRNIKMLSKGTKDLDKLLTTGRTCNVNWGLGYNGGNSGERTQFVKASTPSQKNTKQPHGEVSSGGRGTQRLPRSNQGYYEQRTVSRYSRCWYCGRLEHLRTVQPVLDTTWTDHTTEEVSQ